MAFLLDTHTFLWFAAGDSQLPVSIRDKIKDIQKPCYLSVVSLWEITIKKQIGKLTLFISLSELFNFADSNAIEILPFPITICSRFQNFPFIIQTLLTG